MILRKKLVSFVLITVLLVAGCKKEDNSSPNPPNACNSVTCLNGGYCISGNCNCPAGYTGTYCEKQIPTGIRVVKVDITKFPLTPTSGQWDVSDGPDVYPLIVQGINADDPTVWDSPNFYENAVSNTTYSFTVTPTIVDLDWNTTYSIWAFDYDSGSGDDVMAGLYFTPADLYNSSLPSTIKITANNVSFTLTVVYLFQ